MKLCVCSDPQRDIDRASGDLYCASCGELLEGSLAERLAGLPDQVRETVRAVVEEELPRVVRAALASADATENTATADCCTAAEKAAELGVSREWVYRHKGDLGAITLGGGKRPRLRFPRGLDRPPPITPDDRSPSPRPIKEVELLPIRGGVPGR